MNLLTLHCKNSLHPGYIQVMNGIAHYQSGVAFLMGKQQARSFQDDTIKTMIIVLEQRYALEGVKCLSANKKAVTSVNCIY